MFARKYTHPPHLRSLMLVHSVFVPTKQFVLVGVAIHVTLDFSSLEGPIISHFA